jgi:hypothetical protein
MLEKVKNWFDEWLFCGLMIILFAWFFYIVFIGNQQDKASYISAIFSALIGIFTVRYMKKQTDASIKSHLFEKRLKFREELIKNIDEVQKIVGQEEGTIEEAFKYFDSITGSIGNPFKDNVRGIVQEVQNHLKENKSFDNFRGDEFFNIVFRKDCRNEIYNNTYKVLLPHGLGRYEREKWYEDKIADEIDKQKPDMVRTINSFHFPTKFEDIPNLTFNDQSHKKRDEYFEKLQKYLKDIDALRIKSLDENSYKLHSLEDFYQEVKLELEKIDKTATEMCNLYIDMFNIKNHESAKEFIQNYEALTKKFNKEYEEQSIYFLYKTYLECELTKIKATLEAKSINHIKL